MHVRALVASSLVLLTTACSGSEEVQQSVPVTPGVAPVQAPTAAPAPAAPDAPRARTEARTATRAAAGTPERAVQDFVAALRARRLSEALELATTEGEWAEMEKGWDATREREPSAEEAAQFEQFMAMLTAEGAEQALFALAAPKLAEAQEQVQMLAAMAPMMAAGAMQEAGAPQEGLAVLQGLATKLTTLDVGSEEHCKRAIGILCGAARRLELETTEDLTGLDFGQLMEKADIAYRAVTDILEVYGLGFDAVLDTVAVTTLSVEGDLAELEVSMKVFGVPVDGVPVAMERVAGRWLFQRPEPEAAPAPDGVAR